MSNLHSKDEERKGGGEPVCGDNRVSLDDDFF